MSDHFKIDNWYKENCCHGKKVNKKEVKLEGRNFLKSALNFSLRFEEEILYLYYLQAQRRRPRKSVAYETVVTMHVFISK